MRGALRRQCCHRPVLLRRLSPHLRAARVRRPSPATSGTGPSARRGGRNRRHNVAGRPSQHFLLATKKKKKKAAEPGRGRGVASGSSSFFRAAQFPPAVQKMSTRPVPTRRFDGRALAISLPLLRLFRRWCSANRPDRSTVRFVVRTSRKWCTTGNGGYVPSRVASSL
jgi:hypothetical protein